MKAGAPHDSDDTISVGPQGKLADPGRLWLSAKRDWRWIPLAGLIWGVLGVFVAFVLIKDTFRSDAVLVWEPKTEQRPDARQMAAEVRSLKTPSALSQVRQRLGLPLSLEEIDLRVDLDFDARSGLVVLMADGASPGDAMRLCRVLMEAFLEQQKGFSRARTRAALAVLQNDLAIARSRLDQARKTYDAFRADSGVPDLATEQRLALETVTRLKQEQSVAGPDGGARKAQTARGATQTADAAADRDARKLEQLRAQLAAARARSDESPLIPPLEAQIAVLRARSEPKRPGGVPTNGPRSADPQKPPHSTLWRFLSGERGPGSEAERNAAAQLAKDPAEQMRVAQERVTALAAMERAAQPLRAEIDLAAEQLDAFERSRARGQNALETPRDDWRLLTPAITPARAERAKQSLIAVAMPVAGMLVALLALLLRPILDARVYTAREAAYWAGLPVIASSGWPRNREMFFPLVDELGQQSAGAAGYTLLVGATGTEKALAEDLAYWLGGAPVGSRRGAVTPAAWPEGATTVMTAPYPSVVGASEVIATSAAPGVKPSETLVIREREPVLPLNIHPKGTHAWLGEVEGPALRRAARVADRVVVLLSSGTLSFNGVAGLRTRLGRNTGVALVVIGLSPNLLELPDQAGDVGPFWHRMRRPGSPS